MAHAHKKDKMADSEKMGHVEKKGMKKEEHKKEMHKKEHHKKK